MANWKKMLATALLADGKIDKAETVILRDGIMEDGKVDGTEMKFLVELRNGAKKTCQEFDQFFFEALASNILADGVVDKSEVKRLREILYADGVIDDNEKEFMKLLKKKAKQVDPSFNDLFKECMK